MNILSNNLLAKVDDWVPLIIIGGIIAVNVIKAIANNAETNRQAQKKSSARPTETGRSESQKKAGLAKYFSVNDSYKTIEQMKAERAAQIRKAQIQGKLQERQRAVFIQPPSPLKPAPQRPIAEAPQSRPAQQPRRTAAKHFAQPQKISKQPTRRIQQRPHRHSKIDLVKTSIAAGEIGSKKDTNQIDNYQFQPLSAKNLRQAIIYQEILGRPIALRDI